MAICDAGGRGCGGARGTRDAPADTPSDRALSRDVCLGPRRVGLPACLGSRQRLRRARAVARRRARGSGSGRSWAPGVLRFASAALRRGRRRGRLRRPRRDDAAARPLRRPHAHRNRDGALAPRPERRARLLPLARLGAGVRTSLRADRRRDRHAARAVRLPRGDPLLGRRGQRPLGRDAQGVGVQHRHGGRRLACLACAAADRARVRTVHGRGAQLRWPRRP